MAIIPINSAFYPLLKLSSALTYLLTHTLYYYFSYS